MHTLIHLASLLDPSDPKIVHVAIPPAVHLHQTSNSSRLQQNRQPAITALVRAHFKYISTFSIHSLAPVSPNTHSHTTQLKITQDGVLAMCSSLRAHVSRCVCDARVPEVAGRRCQGMRQEPKTTTTWITVKSCMSQLQVTPSMT